MLHKIYRPEQAAVCFFRSSVQLPERKIMLQITEKCNLHCAHCFAEAHSSGKEMDFAFIRDNLIPLLIRNRVAKVTLTGGEPLVHSKAKEIVERFLEAGIGVSICTNGTMIDVEWAQRLTKYSSVHFNISLDGLYFETHGKFRAISSREEFAKLIENIQVVAKMGLLNGILTTPNKYATVNEYYELCSLAKSIGAKYVLMNPLSPFGRGTKTQQLAFCHEEMAELKEKTKTLISKDFEIVYIRFPNDEGLPLGECTPGSVPYIFCNGDIAICPYMVFAANGSNSYRPEEFMIGNVFDGTEIGEAVLGFQINMGRFFKGQPLQYPECVSCGKECLAIKIAMGLSLSAGEGEDCPILANEST